jgi:hypothetical protein
MSFDKTWDETKPAGSDDIADGDNEIRNMKYGLRERLAVDHRLYADEAGQTNIGAHDKITLVKQTTRPVNVADCLFLWAEDVAGVPELFARFEDGNIVQITNGGYLNGVLLTENQTVGGIKTFSSFPVGPSSAPTTNYQFANKKYVDDQIAASALSTGMIMIWSGSVASIPAGWYFCNGQNGTPDLRDKFVICAKQDDGGVAKSNVTGSLAASGGSLNQPPQTSVPVTGTDGADGGSAVICSNPVHYHTATPPFYALAYIMKA